MSRRPTVALVHKERNLVTSIGLAFEIAGFDVRTYHDGRSALDALSAAPADIGILGRTLPGLYGPQLFVRLRKSPNMPVIFLSSHGDDLAAREGMALGATLAGLAFVVMVAQWLPTLFFDPCQR